MRKIVVFLVVFFFCGITVAELYSPDFWHTFRKDSLEFHFVKKESDIGKTARFDLLLCNEEGVPFVQSKKSVPVKMTELSIVFPAPSKNVDGKRALWIKEYSADNKTNVYGPYGYLAKDLFPTPDTARDFSVALNPAGKNNAYFSPVKNLTVQFAWNPSGLSIKIKNPTDKKVTISLDPANTKGAFLTFANRVITLGQDVKFFYLERSTEETKITYHSRVWEGDMAVTRESDGGIVVSVPWHDLGVRMESGRMFGYMIHGEAFSFPVGASHYVPATWGNIFLK